MALQLPVQSVPITTKVVNSKSDHGEVYSIQVCQWLSAGRWFRSEYLNIYTILPQWGNKLELFVHGLSELFSICVLDGYIKPLTMHCSLIKT